MEGIKELDVNWGKQIQAEEVNEEARLEYKETRPLQEHGDNLEWAMENKEDCDELK